MIELLKYSNNKMNGCFRDLFLRRSYFTYNHIPTVKLSSAIVSGGAPNDKHMIVLHGLFGNKSTFRYLANNEKVSVGGNDIC
jgi:hypothetical protein